MWIWLPQLFPSSISLLSLFYSSSIPPLLLLYPSSIPSLSLFYPSSTPPLSLLYSSSIPPLSLLYPSSIPLLSLFYPSSIPLLSLYPSIPLSLYPSIPLSLFYSSSINSQSEIRISGSFISYGSCILTRVLIFTLLLLDRLLGAWLDQGGATVQQSSFVCLVGLWSEAEETCW